MSVPAQMTVLMAARRHKMSSSQFAGSFHGELRRGHANCGRWRSAVLERHVGIPAWNGEEEEGARAEAELAERFPLHVVCEWLGNTATVAAQSCLNVRTLMRLRSNRPGKERWGIRCGRPSHRLAQSGKHRMMSIKKCLKTSPF